MNYEKKYKEALEMAKLSRLQLLDIGEEATEIEYIFPELIESEDEKIRKALIYHYQGDGCICTNEYRIDYKDICTWLEKQKPVELSEEDEKMLNDILMCGEHHCYLDAGNIAWLKSLKNRIRG